jgi:HEAT repeat protein
MDLVFPEMGKVEVSIRGHIENLNNPDDEVASRAERYLIHYYGTRALEPLIEACGHPNPKVRFRAVWALGHAREPRGHETILRLIGDPDERVRYDATIAMGILGDSQALETLRRIAMLGDDSRPAYMGLHRMGVAAIPVLEELAKHARSDFRCPAINSIGHLAKDTSDLHCMELLKLALDDPDVEVRKDARFWIDEITNVIITDKRLSPP